MTKNEFLGATKQIRDDFISDLFFEDSNEEWKPPPNGYLDPAIQPSDYPELKTKCVRLDVVVMAFYLLTARVAIKSVPGVIRIALEALYRSWLEKAITSILGRALLDVASNVAVVARFFVQVAEAWHESAVNVVAERQLRRHALASAKDLRKSILSQSAPKHRREVNTRHKSRKQRWPNGKRHKHYPVGEPWH